MKKLLSAALIGMLLSFSSAASAAVSDEDFLRICTDGEIAEIEEALKDGANINAKDPNGETPLMGALSEGNEEVAIFLINKGAALNNYSAIGHTPLHIAITMTLPDATKLLISKGADINATAKDDKGFTPLYHAINCSADEMTTALIKAGANPNIATSAEHGASTPLILAITELSDFVEPLVKAGADVNMKDGEGKSPLQWAKEKNPDVVSILKKAGAK